MNDYKLEQKQNMTGMNESASRIVEGKITTMNDYKISGM
jgi:hypothetical protein